MITTNASNFRSNLFSYLANTVKYNEPICISTKEGNAVLLSEDEYKGLIETLYLEATPRMKEEISEGMKTPLEDCVPLEDIKW